MKISLIRGAFLNNFEGQNYDLPLTGYSSLFPLDSHVPFPLIRLLSIADLQKIPFLNLPIKYFTNRTLGDSQVLFGLEAYIKNSDIVHVADPHYYYAYQAACMRERGLINKLVSTWWETIPFNNENTTAKKKLKRSVMSMVDQYICYTEKAKNCLLEEGVTGEKIQVIPLGVDLKQFSKKKDGEQDVFTILFVGRLVEEKGIRDLYKTFTLLVKEKKNIRLKIIGSGPLEGFLKKKIQSDSLSDVITIEQKAYSSMVDEYHHADVLCVPSRSTQTWEEQYGMVFIEAMACGIPIVSYDAGVIKSIVGNSGLIVEQDDIRGLITSIIRIIEVKELAHKLGTMGRERAELLYDANKTKDKIFKLYKKLNGKE